MTSIKKVLKSELKLPTYCLFALLTLLLAISACRPSEPSDQIPEAYRPVVEHLSGAIEYEMADKGLPAFGIVLVDDQRIVWADGFGFEDPDTNKPANAETVYRVGSVSKLFTDIGIMQLVEKGEIDLDAPVTDYIPEFQPDNPFEKSITLRQLTSHRSGLIREPAIGNYFETTEPSLAATVESLNGTRLVYEPETGIKYSNAGIAVVGYVLEKTQEEPFVDYLKTHVLDPMGLSNSHFYPTPAIQQHLAKAYMWTLEGRQFEAPTFQLGMSPAGSMYAPVTDLGQFLKVLFNDGIGPNGPVLKSETLDEMWTPQFSADGSQGFGIGFSLSERNGRKLVGHGGAIYGFATQLLAMPDEKIGVAAVTTMDGANTITTRITGYALDLMLAARDAMNPPLPPYWSKTGPVDIERQKRLEGIYATNEGTELTLWRRGDELVVDVGTITARVRSVGDSLIIDDRHMGFAVLTEGDPGELISNETSYRRTSKPQPDQIPERWKGLIGAYGWDHNVQYVYEEDGRLHILIEWFFNYPLEEIDENTFAFPGYGLYPDEKLVFSRDASGVATSMTLHQSTVFERRQLGAADGGTFTITPLKPVEELREAALAASPPDETGDFRDSDLVELTSLDPSIRLDIRYATTNNFMSAVFYDEPRAFMQRPAAEAVARVHQQLKEKGYGLLIYDAYRPWYVTKMFWDATPEAQKVFVANPANGSRHNRGCAVDLTLFDLATGEVIDMPGGYDEFSERSYPGYIGGTSRQRWHRELLREAMESEGFEVYAAEWWHFDYEDWRSYRVENLRFEEIPN